jgi:serine/threonine-protein kinase SRPK3
MLLDIKLLLVTDRDLPRQSRLVAIKIGKSELCQDAEGESSILQRLAHGPANHAGKEHVVQLLDRFKLSGPNGHHSCLVTEALGPWIRPEDLSPKAAWEVSKQLVEATAYVHEMGVAHGGTCLLAESNAPIGNGCGH